ncbi:MAG: protein kinase [Acidobacteriota bacterium]|nr:protein kinase [Acidobacteriota bacterium]MDH3523709.1 protein kinase [Acidobacteriota bacterium]
MGKVSLRADIRLLRLAIEQGLLTWEDLEAVPQPTEPGRTPDGAAWGPWISRLIESGHLDEMGLIRLIRQLDPEAEEPLPTPEEPKAPVPENWDRYHIFSRLGAGGMGSVFKAFDPQLNRFVALKFLHTKDRQHARAFLDEARAQAQVEHPLICQVYEVGEVEEQPYIAMRFIDGRPLFETASRFPLITKIRLVQQVADGLRAAHQKGLIHRDVKPGNILVTTNQQGALRCIIVDFGLAQTVAGRVGDGEEVAGTPDYLAPEQLRGDAVDHRTDIYSLGVVLYELLTGRVPFRGRNIGQTLKLISEADPQPPSALEPSIPRDLDAIVLKCLAREATDRYGSAAELLRDLERFVSGEPIQAHSASLSYVARKWLRRHRWVALAGALGLASLVALGAFGLVSQRRTRQRAEMARRFSEEVKDMEAAMRYAVLLPARAAGGHRAALEAQIARLGGEMDRLGPLAFGPGHYALGRTYLALRRYEQAKRHLELAWESGYQGAEVAVALGQTIGELYEEATYVSPAPLSTLVAAATREELERVFRNPALEYLRAGSGDSSGRFIQALIAFYEGRYDEAVEAADAAYAARPWFYEARRLVGRIHETRGQEAAHAGEYDEALEHFARAEAVYLEVANVARNDAELEVSICRCRSQRNEAYRALNRLLADHVDEALAACGRALELDPDFAQAYGLESRIQWRWADVLSRRGEDPRPRLELAIAAAQTAIAKSPESSSAHQSLAAASRLLGSWQMLRGIDALPALEQSVSAAQRAIEHQPDVATGHNSLGNANLLIARLEIGRGGDPEARLDQAIASYEKAVDLNPVYTPSLLNLGDAWTTRADWQMARGVDPTSAITRALAALEQAVAINPNHLQLHNNLGNAHNTLALWQLQRGGDPRQHLDAAAASYLRALEIQPEYAIGLYNLAFTERLRARSLIAAGADSAAAEQAAEDAIRRAIELNASDPENFMEYAALDLLRARGALARGASPSAAVRGAEESIRQARALASEAPELFYLEALARRYEAEWSLSQGAPASALLSDGLRLAERALAANPALSESIALEAVLLKLQARQAPRQQRPELARRALDILRSAFAANPALTHEHEADAAELERMLAGG